MNYLLWQNSNVEGEAFIYGGWPSDLRIAFDSGDRILAPVPRIEISMDAKSQGTLTDSLLLTGHGRVFSERLLETLREASVDNLDAYPCTVRNLVTAEVRSDYSVVNVVGKVECIDRGKSEIVLGGPRNDEILGWDRLILDESKIQGWRLFRLAEFPVQIVVRSDVAEAVKRAGLTGVEFVPQG